MHVAGRMAQVICPRCGYAPLIIRGGPLTQENIDRIRVFCFDCAWPFDRQDIERILKTHGKPQAASARCAPRRSSPRASKSRVAPCDHVADACATGRPIEARGRS
jgi:hypothetical protein